MSDKEQPASTVDKTVIDHVLEVITKAKEDVKNLLVDPVHQTLLLGLSASMDKMMGRLAYLTGAKVPAKDKVEFPPVTEFMGEKITQPKKVTKTDLTPKEEEINQFVTKVNRLYSEFSKFTPDEILNSHSIPEDVMVLRGVAKRAGVKDFEDRELNAAFIDDIKNGIADKAANKTKQTLIDKAATAAKKGKATKATDADSTKQ